MNISVKAFSIVATTLTLTVLSVAAAQLEWMPIGGRQLLLQVIGNCEECDEVPSIADADRTREEWRAYFDQRGALSDLSAQESATLMAYLESNLPRSSMTLDSLSTGPYAEPLEGPTLTMEACSACHSPTRALLSEREEDAWLSFLMDKSAGHAGQLEVFGFSEENWRTLAAYLANNMPMDDEAIPDAIKSIGGQEGG